MKQKLVIILCLTVSHLLAQNKTDELNIGIGQKQLKLSNIAPSGVNGTRYGIDFLHTHRLKSNHNVLFSYFAELGFSKLNRGEEIVKYHLFDGGLNAGVFWLRHLPVKSEKINLYAGGGGLFDSDIYDSYYGDFSWNALKYECWQWFLSPSVYFLGNYHLKKFNFRFNYSMPVFSAGFQSGTFIENKKKVLIPNTFVFFPKRFYPQADIAVSYPVSSNDKTECRLQLKYALEQLVYTGYPYERKANNMFKLGMIWTMR